jgi:hypothetical protein
MRPYSHSRAWVRKADYQPIYDWQLGGKDNSAADRELAQKILAVLP